MAIDKIADLVVESDVLVVGGGIAGLPVAWKSAQKGLKVVLADKANPERSGSSATGIDHYPGFFDKGMTVGEWKENMKTFGIEHAFHGGLPFSNQERLYRTYANTQWSTEELEKMGVTMRWTDGEYRFMDADSHWKGPTLRVHWTNVKPEMTRGAKDAGVNIMKRVMITDLLTNGNRVVGAVGINTRTNEFIVFKAKAVVMGTAACSRVYNPETPVPWIYKFRYHWCPSSVSGDGWAMAYRAGAELANMEVTVRGYRFRDDLNLSFGNTGNEGVEARRVSWQNEETRLKLLQKEAKGDGPFYYSLNHLPEDFHKRIEVAYVDERLISFKVAEERGFNPRTHWFEMQDARPNQLHVEPGIYTDERMKTSLEGLYAIGDCVAGSHNVASCSSMALMVGEDMPNIMDKAQSSEIDENQVQKLKDAAMAPLKVTQGPEPMEVECAIRYVIERYVGMYKSEGKLAEGLRRLKSIRREFEPKLKATNAHYLMRANEVRSLFDVADLHFASTMARKESRWRFLRLDYKDKDQNFDNMLTFQKLENGKPVLEHRKNVPLELKYSDDHKEDL